MDISVIIPSYNRAWALPKAIASCKQNPAVKVQILVIDDGSSDDTLEVLSQIEDVEIFKQEKWGKPWAVNLAFKYAKGKYIKFLDSDDWLIPNSLDKQFELGEKQNADLVVAGYEIHSQQGYIKTLQWITCDDFIAQNLGECDSSHYSAFLFRKSFIEDIPHRTSFAAADFASRDDRCLMLEVALKEPKIAIMHEPAFCHLHHDKGRLQFQQSMASVCTNYQHLLIYKNILNQLEKSGRLTKRRINAACKILWPLSHWIAKTHIREATELVQWIYKLNPDFEIPDQGVLKRLYLLLGFKNTQKILSFRRQLIR